MTLLSQKFNIAVFLKEMAAMDGIITSKMLYDIYSTSQSRRNEERDLYLRYKAKNLPIQNRPRPSNVSVNNKINCDFRGDITDMFTGYLFGNPVKYTIKPERYEKGKEDKNFIKDTAFFDLFDDNNNFEDIDLETGKKQSICGRGARLCYVGTEQNSLGYPDYKVMNIDPSECVFIYDPSTYELQYSARFYIVYDTDTTDTGELKPKIQVEFYDSKNIYYYISDFDLKTFRQDLRKETIPHTFDYVPLFEVPNNEERIGDFEKVEELINAYDKSISDSQNEFEAFRLAYLILNGARISDKDLATAKHSGVFQLLENEKIQYLTKMIDVAFVNSHMERLTKNIYRFSKTVDTSSDTFTGAGASGEARKWALLALENKGTIKLNKFRKALQYQFKVLASAWNKVGITLTPDKIGVQFDRNIPVELLAESQFAANMKGVISDRTIFENLSFIKNADDEMARMANERESINLDDEALNAEETGANNGV